MLWMSVFDEPISIIMKNPVGTRIAPDSQSWRDAANAARLAPKPSADTATQRPRPLRSLRLASHRAPGSAPTPATALSPPSALAPPCRMRSAKMGIRTVYGMPVTLTMPSRIRIAWTGGLRMTNRNPSTTREMGDAGWFTASRRFTSISSRPAITARLAHPVDEETPPLADACHQQAGDGQAHHRSEAHTSELQSR